MFLNNCVTFTISKEFRAFKWKKGSSPKDRRELEFIFDNLNIII